MKKSLVPALVISTALLVSTLYPVYAIEIAHPDQEGSASARVMHEGIADAKVEGHSEALAQQLTEKEAAIKEKEASQEAEFKKKVAAFKDQKKAAIMLRIGDNLTMINQNYTNSLAKDLNVMSGILTRFAQKHASASASAQLAINQAQQAILNAQNAVATQSAKVYIINVTTEASAHQAAQVQRDALLKDLKAVRQLVIDAKQAVANAIRTIAMAQGQTEASGSASKGGNEASSSSITK